MEQKDYLVEKQMEYIEYAGPFSREISKRGAVGEWKLRTEYKGYIFEEACYYWFIESPKFRRMPKSVQDWIHNAEGVWKLYKKDLRRTIWTMKVK
jgi:hypothetical protein